MNVNTLRRRVKTHSFRLGQYRINEGGPINGTCEVPAPVKDDKYYDMHILEGRDVNALDTAIHEALHAEGIPDKYIHLKDGSSDTHRIALFLWRLGWRKRR